MCVHTCVCLCVHLAQARGHQCHSITPHLIALTQDLSLGFTLLASLDGVGGHLHVSALHRARFTGPELCEAFKLCIGGGIPVHMLPRKCSYP